MEQLLKALPDENKFNTIGETMAANAMTVSSTILRIPKPDQKAQEKLESLGVKFGKEIDKVLVEAFVPQGWRLVPDGRGTRSRKLTNEKNEKVASVWLKNTGYDYYGWISV